MVNERKRILAFLMIAVLCVVTLVQVPVSAASSSSDRAEEDPYYGRGVLATLPNSEALLYAYDQLVEGIEGCEETVTVYDGVHPLSEAELETVMDIYRRDHTEHFWYGNGYQYSYNSVSVLTVTPVYTVSGDALIAARTAFEQKAAQILGGIRQDMSDFEKELYLHDALAAAVTYRESAHAHDAYGALVEGVAVCEGYAEALQYLCQRVGLTSFLVIGSSVNPSTGQSEGHAWNLIRINGAFYHVDLTWNDQGENLYHAYFNLSDARIARDHAITPTSYPMPQASSDAAHYFKIKGGEVSSNGCTAQQIGTRLKDSGLSVHVYVTDDVSAFVTWYTANIRDVVTAAGVQGGCSYGYAGIGNELILTVIPTDCQHTSLTSVPAEPASCTQNGNKAYYICTCGKWFSDAAGTQEITDTSSVVLAASHKWDLRIEDTAHLLHEGANCSEHHLYGYGCSACGEVSSVVTFYGQTCGDHVYNGSSYAITEDEHREKCAICGEEKDPVPHGDTDGDGLCDGCEKSLSEESETTGSADTDGETSERDTTEETTATGTGSDDNTASNEEQSEDGNGQISFDWQALLKRQEVLVVGGILIGLILLSAVIGAIRRG